MKAKAVVFDMDGVIFDSEKLVLDCWEKIGEKYQIPGIRDVFAECIGTNKTRTKEIVFEHYGDSFDYDSFRQEASALFHEYEAEHGLPLKKGVREILEYLKEKGIAIGLASSTRLAVVEAELKDAGLYEYFKVVMGGDQLKRSKPEPDIYLMTCEKMGITPCSAYAIEDSYNGIRAAFGAGMLPLMVPDMLPPTEEMREKSVAIFDDLLQVIQYFEKERCLSCQEI